MILLKLKGREFAFTCVEYLKIKKRIYISTLTHYLTRYSAVQDFSLAFSSVLRPDGKISNFVS